MTDRNEAAALKKSAPPLTKAELEQINGLFFAYIFRRRKTREIWTTCCGRHRKLPKEHPILEAAHTPEPRPTPRYGCHTGAWSAPAPTKRPEPVACPFCGKKAEVKELGRTGTRKNLWSYRRAVIWRWDKGELWARAYDAKKDYQQESSWTAKPEYKLLGIYRFRMGLVVGTSRSRWDDGPFRSMERQEHPLEKGRWKINSPFTNCREYGNGYDVLNVAEISKSPLRWCGVEDACRRGWDMLKFMTACCFYPRQIEMLMKAGMQEVVRDLVQRGVKNADVIRWGETEPLKALGLNKAELKEFLATARNIDTLSCYKKLRRAGETITITQAEDLTKELHGMTGVKDLLKTAGNLNLRPMRLYRYLKRESQSASAGLSAFKDYIKAAEALGYPLYREDVLLPNGLSAAHDEACRKHRKKLEKERREQAKEQARLEAMVYQERYHALRQKYEMELDGYIIRVPVDAQEIHEEGRKLKHCVAGYADRHMKGTTTILFMRKADKPKEPFLTIQMQGKTLMQIHGYRNEGLYTAKGRFAPDPREEYRGILDPWLDWIAKGSKRDKKGQPVLPKKKEVHIA